MTDLLLTAGQVADCLGLARSTVYHYLESGAIETVRLGSMRGPVRVRESALQKFIEQHVQPAVRPLRGGPPSRTEHVA